MVFDCHFETGHAIWNALSNYMENALKLFFQVHNAQSFQVNIKYHASLYSQFITDSIKTIYSYLWHCIN